MQCIRSVALRISITLIFSGISLPLLHAQFPRFNVLAFYSNRVEPDHVVFAQDAISFFKELTEGEGSVFDTTSIMDDLNSPKIRKYQLVMMINDFPESESQRKSFQNYMEAGGGWMGFHVAAYNDKDSHWPWFVQFLGGGVFYRNSWPPLPAKLVIDDPAHPVTKGMPASFISPHNEWYQWLPSPRKNPKVKVLVSLSPDNYPLGLKDILPDGDCPVVWTNTDYRMIYLNMGHGSHVMSDATQNKLIIDAFRWVISSDKRGDVFDR